jgi:curved DNA-binding protein
MSAGRPFVDYYGILQVDPNCDAKILESAYHHLAKTYHPDRSGTGDTDKFAEIVEAYKILRKRETRAQYDAAYSKSSNGRSYNLNATHDAGFEEYSAIDDADDHAKILLYLYKKRRAEAQSAGVPAFYLQDMLGCSDEHFEFHKWYLKEKGYIALTEQGTLAITIQGVDHVISMSRTARAEKLLIGKAD